MSGARKILHQSTILRKLLLAFLLTPIFTTAQIGTVYNSDTTSATVSPTIAVNDTATIHLNTANYFTLLASDFKTQLTLPFHTTGKEWLSAGKFAVLTAALSLANKPVNRLAVKLHSNNTGIATASKYITNFGGAYEVYAISGFYAYGLVFKSQKAKTTALLATQAYATAGIISGIAKFIFGEQRPYYTNVFTHEKGPIFRGPFYAFKKGPDGKMLGFSDFSSFPSGHTTAAFAAATVYAMEYRDKPLIPVLSYAGATLIGLSRLTENQHWPADVLVGAMLGYLSGKQVVKNYHRVAAGRRLQQRKLVFNLQMLNRQIVPGLLYSF